jgi:hypothetical protein
MEAPALMASLNSDASVLMATLEHCVKSTSMNAIQIHAPMKGSV